MTSSLPESTSWIVTQPFISSLEEECRWRLPSTAGFAAVPDHPHLDGIPSFVIADATHKATHHHQPAVRWSMDVPIGGRIGYFVGIESLAFVGDSYANPTFRYGVGHSDFTRRIVAVTVFDGVNECFFQRQLNCKQVASLERKRLSDREDLILELPALVRTRVDDDVLMI